MFRKLLEYFLGFWYVSRVSGMFLEFLAHLKSFWNVACLGSFWNVSGVFGMYREFSNNSEVLECFESFWHMSGVSGMFREFVASGIPGAVSGMFP